MVEVENEKEELLENYTKEELRYARKLPKELIKKENVNFSKYGITHSFRVGGAHQTFIIKNKKISALECDCYHYFYYHKCSHIAFVLSNYYDDIINLTEENYKQEVSKDIMKKLFIPKKEVVIKKECQIAIDLKISPMTVFLNLKIGTTKFYILKSKANNFFRSYYGGRYEVKFGKDFTYDPSLYYFNDLDQELIEYAYNIYQRGYNSDFRLDIFELKRILSYQNQKTITANGYKVLDVLEFKPEVILDKKDHEYIFTLDLDIDELIPLDEDFEYIFYKQRIYHLNRDYQRFIYVLASSGVNSLVFTDLESFKQSILPIVKNEIELTDEVDDLVVVKKPMVKLYFDLNYSNITLDIKFDYKGKVISYFDSLDSTVFRDKVEEERVRIQIEKYGFLKDKKYFILEDEEAIGYLLEEGLDKLNEDYEVFTSEKMKQLDVVKKSGVKSEFSIGKDNIMKFEFDLGQIDANEITTIFDHLKKNKKYFKLKNGNYLNLEDEGIKQLESLADELNLKSKDLKEGRGVLPKYQAIYLDSLKNSKYHIIQTDHLFNKFIDNFKNYKNSNISLSKKEKDILRDYQETGVKWLYNIYKCDLGGILADEMGLGKSLQTLSFIKQVLKEDKNAKFLIVTPTSLCYNWEKEIGKFAKELDYHVFTELKIRRKQLLEELNPAISITSYGLLREDIELYKKKEFSACIIDEAQNIKNPQAGITIAVKEVPAKTKLALTGTPLENSILELWSIFDFIMPGFFGSHQSFHKRYHVKSFEEEDQKRLKNLNKQISPFILRRKKQDVVKDLPPKIENNVYIELGDEQKKLYMGLVKKTQKEIDEMIASEGFQKSRFKILELLTRLRQLCICPSIIYENYKGSSSKIEEATKVIKEVIDNGHKILLFSSFRTALEIVRKELIKNKISYSLIDGSVKSKKRMELVDDFNEGDTKIFLIMLKAGGTGLNLTSADVVIHLDMWWNPQVENQATDRAHRIGQEKTVEVIKLITKGTIEERILELQEKKRLLTESVIEGKDRNQNMLSDLKEEEIKRLLSCSVEE